MRNFYLLCGFCLCLFLIACGSAETGTGVVTLEQTSAEPTQSAEEPVIVATAVSLPPTPVLTPATDFESGSTSQPPGTYLFIESWRSEEGSETCEDFVNIDEPLYNYSCTVGCFWQWRSGTPDRLIQNLRGQIFGYSARDPALIIGLFGTGYDISGIGGGVDSRLKAILSFPYQASEEITVHSVAEDGTIVAEIREEFFFIAPGQSWVWNQIADEGWLRQFYEDWGEDIKNIPDNCSVVITERLTNFGLLTAEQIDIGVELGSPAP